MLNLFKKKETEVCEASEMESLVFELREKQKYLSELYDRSYNIGDYAMSKYFDIPVEKASNLDIEDSHSLEMEMMRSINSLFRSFSRANIVQRHKALESLMFIFDVLDKREYLFNEIHRIKKELGIE